MMVVNQKDKSGGRGRLRWLKVGLLLLFVFAVASVQQRAAIAQSEPVTTPAVDAPAFPDAVDAATGDVAAVSADEVNLVARELWCPLCSGVRLDSCELKACAQMKEVIALKLAEGEDTASIRTYFVAQYGPQVLGEPPLEGFNWLAWILPFVVLAIGGYVLWRTIRHMTRPLPPTAPASPVSPPPSAPSSAQATPTATGDIPDEYAAKLAEELKRYE